MSKLQHCLSVVCTLLAGAMFATAASALDATIVPGETCPAGSRLMTYQEAQAQQDKLCRSLGMGQWYIGRLAGGGSVDGSGYQCRMRSDDARSLGHVVCVPVQTSGPPPNMGVPDYVIKFAPQLRFTRYAAQYGYPMSAQPFFDRLPKGANGYPVEMPGKAPLGVENTDIATLKNGTIPTYYMARKFYGQVRILYWSFYGYQHPCFPNIFSDKGAHNGDWEHVEVILSQDMSTIAAVSYYQHDGHYTRTIGQKGPCSPVEVGRCNGSAGFRTDGTHPMIYIGRTAHGSYHDANSFLPGADPHAPAKAFECAYYDDYRDPGSDADVFDTSSNLIDLDTEKEAWMAKDRAPAEWHWGPDGIGNHPTQNDPLDSDHQPACKGSSTFAMESAGCFKSECFAGDDQASMNCLKECKPGYDNVGLTCNKGVAPWDWEVYGRLTGGNKYGYGYTIPLTDTGLTRRRSKDPEWDNLPTYDPLPPEIRGGGGLHPPIIKPLVSKDVDSVDEGKIEAWESAYFAEAVSVQCISPDQQRIGDLRRAEELDLKAAEARADPATIDEINGSLDDSKRYIRKLVLRLSCAGPERQFVDQELKAVSGR